MKRRKEKEAGNDPFFKKDCFFANLSKLDQVQPFGQKIKSSRICQFLAKHESKVELFISQRSETISCLFARSAKQRPSVLQWPLLQRKAHNREGARGASGGTVASVAFSVTYQMYIFR